MSKTVGWHYVIDGSDFTAAGTASSDVKRALKKLGINPDIIRRVSICMYEGEINMVIHADGGSADVYVDEERVTVILTDTGPGIEDIDLVMQEGYSTASEEARSLGFGAGMGLPNMKRYADSFDIKSEMDVGTVLTMSINII